MERKKALIAAASAALVLATSGAAIAANLSLLGDDGGEVGELDAESVTNLVTEDELPTTTTTPAGEVIIVDEWVTDPASAPAGAPDPGATGVDLSGDGLPDDDPTPGSSSGDDPYDDSSSDDDSYDDEDEHEDEDEFEDDEHEDEYEVEVEHEDDD